MSFGPVRLLLLLILLLAGGLGWMWLDKHAQPRNLTWTAPKALRPDMAAPAGAPQPGTTANNPATFIAILERPLFAPDRKPPPTNTPPPPDPLANIQIHGIFSGANPGIIARVDGKLRRVKVTETIGPWTLKSIEGRDVTFSQGEETRQLRLAYAPLGTTPAKTAASDTTPTPTSASPTPGGQGIVRQNSQDAARENIRRRNEIRAARGLPLITE